MEKERYYNLDLLKVLAIYMVICFHSKIMDTNFYATDTFAVHFNYWGRGIITASVSSFFFVNGYLLLNGNYRTDKHLKRTLKLTVITILWSIITVLLEIPIKNVTLSAWDIFEIIWNRKVGYTNHLWFMGALICVYVLYPVIKAAFEHERSAFLLFFAFAAILTVGNQLIGDGIYLFKNLSSKGQELYDENLFNMYNPFREINGWAITFFCMGGLAKKYVPKIKEHQKRYNIIAIVAILLAMTVLYFWGLFLSDIKGEVTDNVFHNIGSIIGVTTTIGLFILSLNYNAKNKTIYRMVSAVGSETLGIYFVHYIYIYATRPYFRMLTSMRNMPVEMLYSAGILLISLVTVLILRRIPILKLLVNH